jgi:hypothetical protein
VLKTAHRHDGERAAGGQFRCSITKTQQETGAWTGWPSGVDREVKAEVDRIARQLSAPPLESGLVEYGLHTVTRFAIACIALL